MVSQLTLLKESLIRSEAQAGPENPFVQGLKMQIAKLEKPRAENPMSSPERISVGMRSSAPGTQDGPTTSYIEAGNKRFMDHLLATKAQDPALSVTPAPLSQMAATPPRSTVGS